MIPAQYLLSSDAPSPRTLIDVLNDTAARYPDAAAIDDEMERVAPDLAECLRQVPPDVRRRILRAVNETHRRSETLAAELEK